MKNTITPGSAFDPNFKGSIDWAELRTDREKRAIATQQREAQQALGRHGTIHGLSPRSDAQIAATGRIRKSTAMG